MTPIDKHDDVNIGSNSNQPTSLSFSGGGCCGGADFCGSFSKPISLGATAVTDNNQTGDKMYNYDVLMPLHRNIYTFSQHLAASSSLAHHTLEENDYTEKQPIKVAFEE